MTRCTARFDFLLLDFQLIDSYRKIYWHSQPLRVLKSEFVRRIKNSWGKTKGEIAMNTFASIPNEIRADEIFGAVSEQIDTLPADAA
jgi:hypothetical protein